MSKWIITGVIGLLLVVAAVAVAGVILFSDRRATVAELSNAKVGDVRVMGESEDRFEEWAFRLCWRKANGPWMEYLIDRQVGFWNDVKLSSMTNAVVVKRDGEIIGTLNTADGSFSNALHARLDIHPQVIVTGNDPLDRTNRVYPESPGWNSIWPTAALQSTLPGQKP
jgi:hypothetical protein